MFFFFKKTEKQNVKFQNEVVFGILTVSDMKLFLSWSSIRSLYSLTASEQAQASTFEARCTSQLSWQDLLSCAVSWSCSFPTSSFSAPEGQSNSHLSSDPSPWGYVFRAQTSTKRLVGTDKSHGDMCFPRTVLESRGKKRSLSAPLARRGNYVNPVNRNSAHTETHTHRRRVTHLLQGNYARLVTRPISFSMTSSLWVNLQ